jgi:hypothetical protein
MPIVGKQAYGRLRVVFMRKKKRINVLFDLFITNCIIMKMCVFGVGSDI